MNRNNTPVLSSDQRCAVTKSLHRLLAGLLVFAKKPAHYSTQLDFLCNRLHLIVDKSTEKFQECVQLPVFLRIEQARHMLTLVLVDNQLSKENSGK